MEKETLPGEKNHYAWCKPCQKELRPDIKLPEPNSGNRTYTGHNGSLRHVGNRLVSEDKHLVT